MTIDSLITTTMKCILSAAEIIILHALIVYLLIDTQEDVNVLFCLRCK